MIELWKSRSAREQWLIGGAIGLLIILMIQTFVMRPLMTARSAAAGNMDTATRNLDLVTATAGSTMEAISQARTAPSIDRLRIGLIDAARQRGLSVSRLQTDEAGAIIVQLDLADPTLVFSWLTEVERNLSVTPHRASMVVEGGGLVRGSFEFGAEAR